MAHNTPAGARALSAIDPETINPLIADDLADTAERVAAVLDFLSSATAAPQVSQDLSDNGALGFSYLMDVSRTALQTGIKTARVRGPAFTIETRDLESLRSVEKYLWLSGGETAHGYAVWLADFRLRLEADATR